MKTNVFDVAKYILSSTGEVSTMKLQKMVYYCQAWSLVWDETPLFNEHIEAWANGPVIPALYAVHKGSFYINKLQFGDVQKLDPVQIETIDKVLETLSPKTAKWLIDLTHLESPWIDARAGLSPSDRGNARITHESMFDFYSNL